jgi:hypothetical protein
VDPPRDLLQVLDRPGETLGGVGQVGPELVRTVRDHCLGGAHLEPEGHQALLRAVVEVALDAASGLVAGGDDTGPGCGELVAARLQGSRHRVERALQRPDLGHPGLRHTHGVS